MVTQLSLIITVGIGIFLVLSIVLFFASFPSFLKEYASTSTYSNTPKENALNEYMSELSLCVNKNRIEELCELIEEENQQILEESSSAVSKKNASTVLQWLKRFSVDLHISDINSKKTSTQITYNQKTRKYRLLIPKS